MFLRPLYTHTMYHWRNISLNLQFISGYTEDQLGAGEEESEGGDEGACPESEYDNILLQAAVEAGF